MAGGGVKAGLSYRATDDYGFEAMDEKIHVYDWHATILHLLACHKPAAVERRAARLAFDVSGRVRFSTTFGFKG
jgi:hypothetical protein